MKTTKIIISLILLVTTALQKTKIVKELKLLKPMIALFLHKETYAF